MNGVTFSLLEREKRILGMYRKIIGYQTSEKNVTSDI